MNKQLTNELSRARKKINVVDGDGFCQAVTDVIRNLSGEMFSDEKIDTAIEQVRAGYEAQVNSIMNSTSKFSQAQIQFE